MGNKKDDRSKDKLNKFIDSRIKKLFSGVLDYTEVAVDSEFRWKALRSKILDISNSAMREISKELDDKYSVKYIPNQDVIIINKKER